jgi:dolichol-phosphate mannosyltransferase
MKDTREGPVLSIVIPVYNEDRNILQTLAAIRTNIAVSHEVVIVYDSDEDTTVPVLRPLLPSSSNLQLVKNNIAPGPSGAIRTGFAAAKASWILVMMADLCDDLTQVPLMLEMTKSADVICPSRYCAGGRQDLSGIKVWAPRAAGFLLKVLAGLPTYDPTNSFKLYSRRVLDSMDLSSRVSFSVTLEIVAKAHVQGFRIAELPTTWQVRQHGNTNFKFWRSIVVYFPWFLLLMSRGIFFRARVTSTGKS